MRPAALLATDAAAALPGLRLAWSSKHARNSLPNPCLGWRASISALASAGNSSGRRPTTSKLVATCKNVEDLNGYRIILGEADRP
jgi:hypothetical protein